MWHNMIENMRRLTVPGAPIVYTKFDIYSSKTISKSIHGGCYFRYMPKEIMLNIIEECDFFTIYMFFKTCKKANRMIKENLKWFIDLLQKIKIRIVYFNKSFVYVFSFK